MGNTHRRGGRGHVVNNVMEDEMEALDLEGEPRDPLTPPQPPTVQGPLLVTANVEGTVACITNGICTWCLGDAGPDHPDPCDRPALCLKCKQTGHVIKECKNTRRDFHKPRQDKKKGGKNGGGRNKKDKREEKGEDKKADNNVAPLAQPANPGQPWPWRGTGLKTQRST